MTAEYALFGHRISSPIKLQGLAPADGLPEHAPAIELKVECSLRAGPEFRGEVSIPHEVGGVPGRLGFVRNPDESFALFINERSQMRARIDHDPVANRIAINEDSPTNPIEVTSVLVSPSMPLMLRASLRYFPLHASVLASRGRAIAICGRSGAGKTTFAQFAASRSFTIVADDLAAIDAEMGVVHHGAKFVRVNETGQGDPVLQGVGPKPPRMPKNLVYTGDNVFWNAPGALPLSAVILLSEFDKDASIRLDRVSMPEAALALNRNMSGETFPTTAQMRQKGFAAATRVAKRIPVLRLQRPRGLEHLEQTEKLIRQTVLAER